MYRLCQKIKPKDNHFKHVWFISFPSHSVWSHRSRYSKSFYGTTYQKPIIRMILRQSHSFINQRLQQLFIRNKQCARHTLRLHFLSICSQRRVYDSFWPYRQNITNWKPPVSQKNLLTPLRVREMGKAKYRVSLTIQNSIMKWLFPWSQTQHLQIHLTLITQGD